MSRERKERKGEEREKKKKKREWGDFLKKIRNDFVITSLFPKIV